MDDCHGVAAADPHHWLEDSESDETREWISAQRRFTTAWMGAIPRCEDVRARLDFLAPLLDMEVPPLGADDPAATGSA